MPHPADLIYQLRSETTCFNFDVYSDLLGGISWDDFKMQWFSSDHRSEKPESRQLLKDRFNTPNQFLLSDKISRLCPLEILWLKWHIFSDLCHDIHVFHRDKKKPHLNISPQSVQISTPNLLSESLPARWVFSLALEKRKASRRFSSKEMPDDFCRQLFMPPKGDDKAYQMPIIREQPFGAEVSGMVAVRSIEKVQHTEEEAEEGKQTIAGITEFHFVTEEIQQMMFSEHDVFLAKLYFYDEPDHPVEVWASQATPLEKGILLNGAIKKMDVAHWEKFEGAKESIFSHATLKIYKAYHAPCDLYSLGMMLLHLLLVNEEQGIDEVYSAVQRLALRLPPMVQGLGPEDQSILLERFQAIMLEEAPVFSKSAIFYSSKHQESIGPPISDNLWTELLIFALRLTTFIPGFSYSRNHGDVDFEHPHLLMAQVIVVVADFSERMKQDLFALRQRDVEIQVVCDLLRKELAERETQQDAI